MTAKAMKEAFPPTYKVGSLREFAEWTKRVVRDPKAAQGVPKKCFATEVMAKRASGIGGVDTGSGNRGGIGREARRALNRATCIRWRQEKRQRS